MGRGPGSAAVNRYRTAETVFTSVRRNGLDVMPAVGDEALARSRFEP